MGYFGSLGSRWIDRAIAANLPYFNVLFVNVAQAIIAVFLASDFLRRDKKLDTTEVIYTRPISNGEYVVGKTLGILALFIGLVVLALLMALVFNLVRQDTPVIWQAYLYYPLLITIPTLVFIFGLSFFLMILIRNQAVTFVVLLGYIGLTLFYFQDKVYGLLDYLAFNLPMIYSDFIGFGDPYKIYLHRLAYLLMGTGFIFATIRFLSRLPQTGRWNALNVLAFVVFIASGSAMAYSYYSLNQNQDKEREFYLSLNNQYAEKSIVDIISNDLYLAQKGQKLEISSEITVRNTNRQIIDTLIFSLNPGFTLDSITSVAGSIEFNRNRQLIFIIPEEGLAGLRRTSYSFYYSGVPDETVAYLDIPKDKLVARKRIVVASIDKKPGIVSSDYVLLTPEMLWYPVAGVAYNQKTFMPRELDFVSYTLSVKPNSGLMPVAPGNVVTEDEITHFSPEMDLNALSLAIGPFEKRSIEIEGVEYNLFLKPGHDYFSGLFSNISDTLSYLIKDAKDEYEIEELDLYYPFSRINLVETPIQFHAYDRPQIQTTDIIQPEMIFLPEKGSVLSSMAFARYKYREERDNRRNNEVKTEKEIETDMFNRFLRMTFFRASITASSFPGQGGEPLIIFKGDNQYEKNPYCVFPLYYSYVTGISSSEYPLFNSMLEIYLKEGFTVSPRESFTGGMTDSERANLALRDKSMIEIFSDPDNDLSSSLVKQTGSFIFLALRNRVGASEFDNFLYYYLEDRAFYEIYFEQFAADFNREFGVEIEPYFETIQSGGKIATFLMSSPEFVQTRDEIGEVYLVKFKISNTGEAKGLVDATFRMPGQFGGPGGGGGGMTTEQRLIELDAGVTKDVQFVFYDQPRMLTINTLISGNIPSTFNSFLRSAESVRYADIQEYERISDKPLTLEIDGEYIVDNEDPGFQYVTVSNKSKLKELIESYKKKSEEIEYESINQWWTPSPWITVAHSGFYGEAIRSAVVCGRGSGGNTATWTTILPAAGFYDVYIYVPMTAMLGRPDRNRRERNQGGGGGPPGSGERRGPPFADEGYDYHYIISSNEGSEEIEFKLENIEDGWNKLGAFHFPADTARIELSNRTDGRRIFADAVKWVRR